MKIVILEVEKWERATFIGKTLRIYTVSGVESYLGVVEEVKEEYVVLKSYFEKDRNYLALKFIESFKVENMPG